MDLFTFLGNNISSTEIDVNIHQDMNYNWQVVDHIEIWSVCLNKIGFTTMWMRHRDANKMYR